MGKANALPSAFGEPNLTRIPLALCPRRRPSARIWISCLNTATHTIDTAQINQHRRMKWYTSMIRSPD